MQGCGGRRRICSMGVLMLLLEYGVHCLPLDFQFARNGPSKLAGSADQLIP
jgi:hypothetical protein